MEELQEETLEKLNLLTEKFEMLEGAFRKVSSENVYLKETINKQADEISHLKDCHNEREQNARSWSIRVLNLPLPPGQESNTRVVMNSLYQRLLLPILEGAKEAQDITTIPSCEALLETAHILPGKGATKPIIARFHSRYWRSVIFRHRKAYAPREEAPANTNRRGAEKAGRMAFAFFEDLTKATFRQLQAIKACEEVLSAWTVSGSIRFKTKNSETIYKVSSIFDTVESLTSQ